MAFQDSTKNEQIHTEVLNDIITTPPSWLLKWGVTIILGILVMIIVMSAFIKYPDVVRADIKINAVNAPKALVPKISGTLVKILVKEGDMVNNGDAIAWLETTGNHRQVLTLLKELIFLRAQNQNNSTTSVFNLELPNNVNLGELQSEYQIFYQAYISYQSAASGGIYLKQKQYLLKEINNENEQRLKLVGQKKLLERDYQLALKQYQAYNTLAEKKVVSPMELQEKESFLLSKQRPLEQIESQILSREEAKLNRQSQLAELEDKIQSSKLAFVQDLNSLISKIEHWKSQYILSANQKGKISYSGALQEKQYIESGQPLFFIDPGSTDYFCEVYVQQNNMGKVKLGQRVLVKMNSFPFEEFGHLSGEIVTLTDIPYKDDLFLARAKLTSSQESPFIKLKVGMTGVADIVTIDANLLQRFGRNLTRAVAKN